MLCTGIIGAGCSYTHVDRLFANLNMPNMTFATFKKYEQMMGTNIEKVAKESCDQAAKEERELTIQNKTTIEQIL